MADLEAWETEQRAALAGVQQKVDVVRAALCRIKVRASSRNGELGVTVNAQGHVRDIHLTAQALRLGETRLAQVLLETIQRAEADAARQAADAARPLTDDRLISETMEEARRMTTGKSSAEPPTRRPMSEQEIQAADDAYFERLNRGWAQP
ncbi:YbaB/EbfC family nucleoid-associated protein [Nocardia sp. NEAU-G5]|uniref:YbaB/EbfC family nucleoid-associated protein n=1 Tax=Nocardia albiluteola TaxID=2842303 RepID=A0ABS6BAE7_9NOCA|nr:YbaB/EbfC family nucleoid-associated protein [Nocardia albiluteola]MBU3066401.1 YbaB/EbfC family nucleoid-associated protein [Nocardia albiluteola]